MITGFNTDIKHGDRVFHVQTEDRGLGNPIVESLVYVGGEILLSKKSPYKDHLKGNKVDEKAVKEMMDLQHRRIIEAIRRGRFDGARPGQLPSDEGDRDDAGAPLPEVSAAAAAATAAFLSSKSGPLPIAAPAKPAAAPPGAKTRSSSAQGRTQSGINSPPSERSLDQVIIDYLSSEAASEHLELSLVTGGDLVAGEAVPLSIRAATSLTEKPVAGAHISVRVVSTSGPPQILFRGITGSDGFVKATCNIPDIGNANAALIIAASSSLGNNEVKQLIKKKR